jgi:hypothetical protein
MRTKQRSQKFFRVVFSLLTTGAVLTIFTFPAAAQVTNGLVGWWRFDEGTGTLTADASGNGNNGTLVNKDYYKNLGDRLPLPPVGYGYRFKEAPPGWQPTDKIVHELAPVSLIPIRQAAVWMLPFLVGASVTLILSLIVLLLWRVKRRSLIAFPYSDNGAVSSSRTAKVTDERPGK